MASTVTVNTRKNSGGPHCCGWCSMSFRTDDLRRGHVNRVHAQILPHQCKHCSRRFETTRAAETHAGWHHPEYRNARNDPAKQREWNLKKNYGITLADFAVLLERQGGGCAVCRVPDGGTRSTRLHVDHDHMTGTVRGLLCTNCNTALGKLKDDPAIIARLGEYAEGGAPWRRP